jgi:hypothetical protein
MFHTYVLAASGAVIDMNQAQFLMDKTLARQSAEWVSDNWPRLEQQGASSKDQAFFDHYCERHREKYGRSFVPDVDPRWDSRPSRMARA